MSVAPRSQQMRQLSGGIVGGSAGSGAGQSVRMPIARAPSTTSVTPNQRGDCRELLLGVFMAGLDLQIACHRP